jgi:hypothetical protein
MKPLILWKSPYDPKFSRDLESRLRGTVLREWSRRKKEHDRRIASEKSFSELSQSQRLRMMRKRTLDRLKKIGMKKWASPAVFHSHLRDYYERIHSGLVNDIFSSRIELGRLHLASINASPSATKTVIRQLSDRYDLWRLNRFLADEDMKKSKVLFVNHFVLSLRQIPSTRIEDVLPWAKPDPSGRIYSASLTFSPYHSSRRDVKPIPSIISWHFISPIRSEHGLIEELNHHILSFVAKQAS